MTFSSVSNMYYEHAAGQVCKVLIQELLNQELCGL